LFFFCAEIWLYEKKNPASGGMFLFYQVSGVGRSNYVSPFNYLFKGRISLPINSDLIIVSPTEFFLVFCSSVLQIDALNSTEFQITVKVKIF
jgi:hypothetical protein